MRFHPPRPGGSSGGSFSVKCMLIVLTHLASSRSVLLRIQRRTIAYTMTTNSAAPTIHACLAGVSQSISNPPAGRGA